MAAVLTVRDIASRLQDVSDIKLKAPALARVADILWKDDEPHARQLFLKAYELTSTSEDLPASERRKIAAVRREVLGALAHRDPKLAKKLIEDQKAGLSNSQRAETNLAIAYQLLDAYADADNAEAFARSSLSDGMRVAQLTVWLLELREKNQARADSLFQDLIRGLLAQPVSEASDILYLGTYLFTSPRTFSSSPTTRSVTMVGGIPVPDLTADRPNIPVSLVRAYLSAATTVLLQETTDAREQKLRYVATYLFIPKAERFAPELLPALWKAQQVLSEHVPPAFTQQQTFANLNKPTFDDQDDIDRILEEIRKLPDQTRRDVRYVSLLFMLWSKGNFLRAREVSERISDLRVQREVNCLIDFGSAAQRLDRGEDVVKIENVAKKLSCGLERVMLWLAVANAWNEAGDKQRGRDALMEALTVARSIEGPHRPFLLLNVTRLYANLDPEMAQTILREAVKGFNQQSSDELAALTWNREITVGPLTQPFALKAKGIDFGFEKNLQLLITDDSQSTLATIKTLTNERALTAGLFAVARAVLK